jgi:hypothetical protein
MDQQFVFIVYEIAILQMSYEVDIVDRVFKDRVDAENYVKELKRRSSRQYWIDEIELD